ncbi:MAG: c-type cytochrome biogenesis protein CcmI [Gammaproteobacteria bacterium]|nr:c-type cytochrome biogenesis protein CcmI [Gammaproteobacteria bacterium]
MIFWISAAGLLVLALVMLLPPMLRRVQETGEDQRRQQNIQIAREQKQQLDAQLAAGEIDQAAYDSAYRDLQTALALELDGGDEHARQARGRWMVYFVLLFVPVTSVLLYLHYGEHRVALDPQLALATPQSAPAPQMSLDEMQAAIRVRLQQNPEDAEGWFMLGRVFMAKQQFDDAVTAYQRSYDLIGEEPGVMFALADALAMRNNGSLAGEPERLVLRGLELSPNFPNGLWLAGMAAEQRQDFKAAHAYWTRLLPMIQDNPRSALEVRNLIRTLEEREPELATASAAAVDGERQLSLSVDITPDLRARAEPDTAVFVYARAQQGPPMPLAVKRLTLAELPVSLTLGDEDAMMPAMKLSGFDQVVVGARVSLSGNPVAQDGDFYTEIEAIDSTQPPAQLELVIDRVR